MQGLNRMNQDINQGNNQPVISSRWAFLAWAMVTEGALLVVALIGCRLLDQPVPTSWSWRHLALSVFAAATLLVLFVILLRATAAPFRRIREILERILVEKEYRVVAVSNAVEAIEVCKKERIDCVFLDIKMPGKMDGYAAFDEIRRIDNAIRVILITGQAEDEKLQGYVKQADGYVRKPFKVQAIYEYLDV